MNQNQQSTENDENYSDYMIRDTPKSPSKDEVFGKKRFDVGYFGKQLESMVEFTEDDIARIIPDSKDNKDEQI